MSQVSKYPVRKNVYERIFDIFLETFSKLKSKKEVSDFFDEFLTPTEKIMLAKRLAINILLAKDFGYREISEILRVSSTTISSVSDKYKYGKTLNKITQTLINKEGIEDFWLEIADACTAMGMVGTKGTSGWKYLNNKINKKRTRKPF